ncbi:Por secretion system C-terminal sorting domain-containing protein [Lutibacter agarilyticus]|uniref:Por secretion system C-terminal sorting domain-containing protein n=1 Tax=Lutibacter agarilyticus TaxID=1109740 RepID=A0A238W6L0_9FLAO|nr:GEVED domain-containing protein [Lutibacter agarilyticus]SNR41339.1 Por secretion system C-terminal sorting domain-containing protein [Lutibacter agarilyticus]
MGYIKNIIKITVVACFFIHAGFGYGQTTIIEDDFESGYGNWNAVERATIVDASPLNSGRAVLFDNDNGNQSFSITTVNNLDLTPYTSVDFIFDFSADFNNNDGFTLQFSNDGGSTWIDVRVLVNNLNFINGDFFAYKVKVRSSDFNFTTASKFRIQCDVKNATKLYLDNILIRESSDDYCEQDPGNSNKDDYISKVQFNTINKNSGNINSGYSDFTYISTDVFLNDSHDLTVTINLNKPNSKKYNLYAWFDWNKDGNFNNTDERESFELSDKSPQTVTKSITIPSNAAIGNIRMRIMLIWNFNGEITACTDANGGEVEDYTINIINGCSINSWTGAVSSDWNNPVNWSCGTVPTITTNVLIPASVTNYPEIAAADAGGLANDIEIENGATLTVFDNSIEVDGTLLLNGVVDLEGEGQLIQKDGSILDDASTGYITRSQQGTANLYSYNYWGSPVGVTKESGDISISDYSYTVPAVLPSVTFLTSGYNGSSSPLSLADYWIWKFADRPAGNYSEWQHMRSSGEIKAGEGFTMKGTTTGDVSTLQNYTFRGLPNNGAISLAVSGGNEYLVANPYPSAIDGFQFINDNNPSNPEGSLLTGTLYFWQQFKGTSHNLADYEGGYATLTLSGGSPAAVASIGDLPDDLTKLKTPGQYIPVAQGFFTSSDADGGKIKFNNGQRFFVPESSGSSIFMKSSNSKSKTVSTAKEYQDVRPKFRLGFKAPQIKHRQLLLTIDEKTTNAVDWGYDGEMNGVLADDMYWALDNKKYVIQGLPDANIDREIPLGIKMSKAGLAIIQIDALENVDESVELYIKDELLGTTTKINNTPFEIELEAGEYTNRFSLVFKQNKTLDIEDEILKNGLFVYVNNIAQELRINNTTNVELLAVNLYNNLGQELRVWTKNLEDTQLVLPVNNLATGMYVVQLKTSTGAITKKVIIK